MIYLLLLILGSIVIISYTLTKRDLLSPWFISSVMFLLSASFAAINAKNWDFQLNAITIVVICIGLCSFGIGELLVRNLAKKRPNSIKSSWKNDIQVNQPVIISPIIMSISTALMACITYFYYKQVLRLAYSAGYTDDSELPMLRFARIATTENSGTHVDTNIFVGQGVVISYAFAYILLFILIYNIINFGFKKYNIFYLLPIVLYIIQIILTGGRTQFIYLVASTYLISVIVYQIKVGWIDSKNSKMIKNGIIIFILMLIVFYLLGSFTGKTEKYNIFETISIYVGSSIVGFDNFLENFSGVNGTHFGENTLFGIYGILGKLGFSIPALNQAAEFTQFGDYETNIYTSYMRYIKDFSYVGLILIEIGLGMLFSYLYLKIKNLASPSLIIIVYAILFQVIIECSIEERFFMNILSLGYILRLFYVFILYKIIFYYINSKSNLGEWNRFIFK